MTFGNQPTNTAQAPTGKPLTGIQELMMEKAGVTYEQCKSYQERDRFRDILVGMLMVHQGKGSQYGEYFEKQMKEPDSLRAIMAYGEVKRKFNRLENFAKDLSSGKITYHEYASEMIELLTDIGVYCAMGVDTFYEEFNTEPF
tara:strand:- start:266 stop:694 length:429 start_codon:yes stop_codon:yes gene_type:complete